MRGSTGLSKACGWMNCGLWGQVEWPAEAGLHRPALYPQVFVPRQIVSSSRKGITQIEARIWSVNCGFCLQQKDGLACLSSLDQSSAGATPMKSAWSLRGPSSLCRDAVVGICEIELGLCGNSGYER